jgi:hypothetical protein
MNDRWIRIAMVAMLFAVAAPVAHADDDGDDNGTPSTVAPLTGETFSASETGGGSSTVTGECRTDGESTFHFTVTGTAAGPFYPGTFSESGTIVLGPPGVNQATSFNSSFTINALDGSVVTGSKSLEGFESTSLGLCNAVSPPNDPEPMDQITAFEATVSYVATITTPSGSGMDSGTSHVDFQDFQVRGISNGFNFFETFVSTSGPAPGECDDDNDDQGDDDCDDQGEDG